MPCCSRAVHAIWPTVLSGPRRGRALVRRFAGFRGLSLTARAARPGTPPFTRVLNTKPAAIADARGPHPRPKILTSLIRKCPQKQRAAATLKVRPRFARVVGVGTGRSGGRALSKFYCGFLGETLTVATPRAGHPSGSRGRSAPEDCKFKAIRLPAPWGVPVPPQRPRGTQGWGRAEGEWRRGAARQRCVRGVRRNRCAGPCSRGHSG